MTSQTPASLNIIPTPHHHFSVSGIHLKICPRGVTCCTPDMETKLMTLSRDSFSQALAATTAHLQASFNAKSRKFDGELEFDNPGLNWYSRPVEGPNGPLCPVIIQFGIKITILNYLHLTLNIFFRILH